ncbi:4'-phosphopantetheinyl transferase [Cryptosporangium sp. NPDC051539]|uniref:4'-phosphopantetheinyl transferase n=1 Tax=Cryptosporangium sp. NPDC051539 TaxID=3363962 RepID=UPI0037A3DBA4
MIAALLPAAVVVVEAYADDPHAMLFPAERDAISAAVPVRRNEYATVRACARQALARLGLPPAAILSGARGAPQWPDGAVGSMTHCTGFRAAALARTGAVTSLGIDAEPHRPLPDGILPTIAGPSEQAVVRELSRSAPHVRWDTLLFSAKESVYKAWFPRTGLWLGFEEAEIDLRPDGTFSARLVGDAGAAPGAPPAGFQGRWTAGRDLLATAIAS